MADYVEDRQKVVVPGATGVDGYLKVIRSVLELPRVREIVVGIGVVSWMRLKKVDEPERNVEIDLDTLMPYSIIRSSVLTEITPVPEHAATALGHLFMQAHLDGLMPIALVTGGQSYLHPWYKQTTGEVLPTSSVHGLDLLFDPNIGQETLVLCAGLGKRAALVDTVRSYKITMPWRPK